MRIPVEAIVKKYAACDQCKGELIMAKDKARCASCGREILIRDERLFFSDPPPIEENKKSPHYQDWSPQRKAHYDFFERTLPTGTDLALLDVGAGPTQFRKLFLRFASYVGLDFYPYSHVSVVSDVSKHLPLKSEVFDIVVLSNLLEHVPDAQTVLTEAYRVLKQGGVCCATIPFLMRVHQAPYDFNRFTLYQLQRLFENAGFRNVQVEPLGLPMDVYRSMQRHFFGHLLDALKAKGGVSGLLLYPLAQGARILMSALFRIFKLLYAMAMPNERYTEGYGIRAKKA